MTFAVSGDALRQFHGPLLAAPRAAARRLRRNRAPARALDVGCGAGALTAELTSACGLTVAAADPSTSLVEACRRRVPAADVRLAPAESLPWQDASFDAALAQLVVNFMADATAGAARDAPRHGQRRMSRLHLDLAGGMRMLRTFWDAAVALDVNAPDEAKVRRFQSAEELDELWRETGLHDVETTLLDVAVEYEDFDDFWLPSRARPAGATSASLDPGARTQLRDECFHRLGEPGGPFTLAACGRAGNGRARVSASRRAREHALALGAGADQRRPRRRAPARRTRRSSRAAAGRSASEWHASSGSSQPRSVS